MDTDDGPVVLFDGICNLCERSVQLVVRNDRAARFRFAPLQSDVAARLLKQHEDNHEELSSMVLIERGQLFRKSRAALRVARQMDGLWPLMYYGFAWIPLFIADPVYDFIGRRRYRWFGEKSECWVPTEDLRSRFLSDSVDPDERAHTT